jgi:ABC-type transport system involved in multi-copper enzyme maturation permease subunit
MPEDANPVQWRERCVQGIAPFGLLRAIPVWLAAPAIAIVAAAGLAVPVYMQLPPGVDLADAWEADGPLGLHEAFQSNGIRGWDVVSAHGSLAFVVLTLILAVRASGGIAEERERGTWDALLLTPLTTTEIVRGKFWGVQIACVPYLAAYAVGTFLVAALIGPHAMVGVVIAVGTLVVIAPWVGASGTLCSAFLRTSWRSLLATLGLCYAYLVLASFLAFIALMVAGMVSMILAPILFGPQRPEEVIVILFAAVFGGVMLVLSALVLVPASYGFLFWAENRIDKRERAHVTRHEGDTMRLVPRLEKLAIELAEEELARDREGR